MADRLTIGHWVDHITGNNRRKPARIACRAMEEMTEAALAAGASAADIIAAVTDAIHNQCLKQSEKLGRTVFPSELQFDFDPVELAKELGDNILCLQDLEHVAGIPPGKALQYAKDKYDVLVATPPEMIRHNDHTFYLVKPHVKGGQPFNKETQDQIAAIMLQSGTPEQQAEALAYAKRTEKK